MKTLRILMGALTLLCLAGNLLAGDAVKPMHIDTRHDGSSYHPYDPYDPDGHRPPTFPYPGYPGYTPRPTFPPYPTYPGYYPRPTYPGYYPRPVYPGFPGYFPRPSRPVDGPWGPWSERSTAEARSGEAASRAK
jgi:hypothetical protein